MDERELIEKKYGYDLKNGQKGILNSDESRFVSCVILKKLKNILKTFDDDANIFNDSFSLADFNVLRNYIEGASFQDSLKKFELENSLPAVLSIMVINDKYVPLSIISLLCGVFNKQKLIQMIEASVPEVRHKLGIETVSDSNSLFSKSFVYCMS